LNSFINLLRSAQLKLTENTKKNKMRRKSFNKKKSKAQAREAQHQQVT